MDFWPILEMRLDYWSVLDRLSEIESYPWDGVKNEYYDDYADLFNEMAGLSAEFYNEFERLIRDLEYTWSLPKRKLENTGIENARGAAWFDMAVSLLNETDMSVLLENEGVYDPDDIDRERQKRRKAVLALTKEQQFSLFTQVFHFLMRFIQLSLAFETVKGSIDELERLNSLRETNGRLQLPSSAYL